jgi:curved DNA-binding protein CbpA
MDIEEARDILSVESDASEEKIDERYRELVQKNHPDKGGSSNLFKQIEEAYELLTQVSEEGPEDDSVKNKQEYFKKHELNDKFELGNTSKSDIKEIVEKSFSTNVTENLITGKKSEAANINKIVSRPVLNYMYRNEQIHFVFTWNKIQFGDDVLNPNNGGIALFTNNRIGIIADLEKKGIEHSIFHEEIQSISSSGGGKKSEFSLRIKLRNKKMIIGLDNRNMDYLSLSDYHEMDREVEAVRSLIDQASVIF